MVDRCYSTKFDVTGFRENRLYGQTDQRRITYDERPRDDSSPAAQKDKSDTKSNYNLNFQKWQTVL